MDILDKIKNYDDSNQLAQFPPVGDWHGINGCAFFGMDKLKAIYQSGKEGVLEYEKKYRKKAKGMGLGLNYGGSYKVLQSILGGTEAENIKLFGNYFKHLKYFKKHLVKLEKEANKDLFVLTFLGRRLYLPALGSDNWMDKAKARNKIYNSPIQSLGAETIKLILNVVGNYLEKNDLSQFQNNNICKNYYQRIVSLDEKYLHNWVEDYLEQMEDGNVKILIKNSKGTIVKEFDRNLHISMRDIEELQMKVEW